MSSLPLLIGILPIRYIQKAMIVECGLFVVTQVIISGGPNKETENGHLPIQQRAPIERSDREFVVLVLARRKGQIDVHIWPVPLQSNRDQKFLFGFGEFFLPQQSLTQ